MSTTVVTSAVMGSAHEPVVATFLDEDPALTQRVETAIARDPDRSIAARNVNVTVHRNVVTLSGSVEDYATRDAVEAVVEGIPGIATVYNDVQVWPLHDENNVSSDENIAFSLQRSLVNEPRVTIDVERGVVTLRGEPRSTPDQLEQTAYRTPGVAAVVNELSAATPAPTLVQ